MTYETTKPYETKKIRFKTTKEPKIIFSAFPFIKNGSVEHRIQGYVLNK